MREWLWNKGALTCGVEAEEQGARHGKGQDPHGGDHHKNPLPGAMAGVVHDGHHDGRVPARMLTLALNGEKNPNTHAENGKKGHVLTLLRQND